MDKFLEDRKQDQQLTHLRNAGGVVIVWVFGAIVGYWDSWQAVTNWWWAW